MSTVHFGVSADYGHTGQYICKIVGRAERVQFNRQFVGTKYGKRNDGTSYDTDETGLYETQDSTRKGKRRNYYVVLESEGELFKLDADKDDALKIAKRFDGGETIEQIVGVDRRDGEVFYAIRSAAECKRAEASATVDAAQAIILATLEALPDSLQKKVLAEVRKRLFPTREEALGAAAKMADLPTIDAEFDQGAP